MERIAECCNVEAKANKTKENLDFQQSLNTQINTEV